MTATADRAEEWDRVTVDLIFALRDSLTDDGPSRLEFWSGRAASALETAAAGSDTAGQVITTCCRKLQIPALTARAARAACAAAAVIDVDLHGWAEHVARTGVYIVALAQVENTARKTPPPAALETL